MIVSTKLARGGKFTLQRLQELSGFGRTLVHDAVKRLATNQLILVNPRSGLQITLVDLVQERILLSHRIEMEWMACGLACERMSTQDRMIFHKFIRDLKAKKNDLGLDNLNVTHRLLNNAILAASHEPLLEKTLLPLQTLYRRTGWLFHNYITLRPSMRTAMENHISLLHVILAGD